MKKFLLSIFAVLFAFAGVQAQETVTDKLVATSFAATSTTYTNFTGVKFDSEAVYAGNSAKASSGAIQLRSSNSNSGIVTTKSGGKAKKIVVEWQSTTSNGRTLEVYGKNSAYTNATDLYSITSRGTKIGTIVKGTSTELVIEGDYEYIGMRSASNAMYLTSISIVWETNGEGGGETPVAPAAPTLPATQSFDNSMTVEITNIAADATVYYTTDESDPATSDTRVEYTEPFKITATTTVKAVAVNEGGSSEVVSATYTKNTPVTPPAEGDYVIDELTHSWAGITGTNYSDWSGKKATSSAVYAGNSAGDKSSIQLRSNNSNSGIVTTKTGGKAKKIVVEWNSGTSNGRTLDVYGKNSAYSAATDLYSASTQGTKLGSIVYGTSTELTIDGDYEYIGLRSNSGAMYLTSISITWDASNVVVLPDAPEIPTTSDFVTSMNFEIANFGAYEDGTTVYYSIDGGEFTKYTVPFAITTNSVIVAYAINGELKSAESTAEYTRITNDPVITVVGDTDADAFEESIEVEIATQNGAKAYYTLNGEEPTIESTEYEGALTIKATATLKVIAVEEGEYRSKNVASKTFTMALKDTSVDAGASSATFDASAQEYENGAAITSVAIVEGITATFNKGTNNNNAPKYYTSGTAIRCYGGNNFTIESTVGTITKIVLTFSSGEDKNAITTDCGTFSTDTWMGNANSVKFTIGGSSGHRRIKTITVTYGEPENESYSLNVTEAGWATLFLDYAVAIPAGVTCYVIEEGAFDGETVELTPLENYIPANTGVIVKAESEEYVFEPVKEDAGVAGLMSGSTSNKYFFENAYVLGVDEKGVVGLYKAKMAGGAWLNNANKAYLPASEVPTSAQGTASFSFRFGEGTTGVENVEVENTVKVIYDLTGRRVEAITAPGIYIVGGKKVLVK